MKRNIWFNGVALLLTACLLTSCTTTTTWREIRKDPDKYMRQDRVAIKGQVDSVYLAPQGDTGKLVVRDSNGDSGRVEFRDRRAVRGMGDKVVVSGKVQEARRDTGPEYYMLLEKLEDVPGWWVVTADVVVGLIVLGGFLGGGDL